MRLLNLIKNPVLRNKTNYKVSNPVGDIVEEIREQDIVGLVGGNFERISAITEVTAWEQWRMKNLLKDITVELL